MPAPAAGTEPRKRRRTVPREAAPKKPAPRRGRQPRLFPQEVAISPRNPRRESPYKSGAMTKTRTETDTFGPIEVDASKYWGAQARALAAQFQDRLGEAAASDRARAGHRQARRGRSEHGARPSRPEDRQGHRRGRAGSDRRQARRAFPAVGVADRLRHAVEHERQRGDLQPRHRDAGRRDGLEEAGPSQRSRQHEPVVERHLSDGHAHRLRGGDPPSADPRAAANCATR